MTSDQIRLLADHGRFPGPNAPVEWLETHISWVILTPAFAFKIKKPVQFPFLDFSTLEKRQFYCREELRLNRRLAPEMYLDVLPIRRGNNGWPEISMAGNGGSPLDYAVFMKRMDDRRQMDLMLRQNAVAPGEMEKLAAILVRFHRSVIIPANETGYEAGGNRADFEDLFRLEAVCSRFFGLSAVQTLEGWRRQVATFLDTHETRLHRRAESGFWVDGHGDLHARNIFLLPEDPVVFDCIEFNPHLRKGDVLSELAFLCMDLDAGGHHELVQVFLDAYFQGWRCVECPEDARLFLYFKAYRANVRLKVALMELEQHPSGMLIEAAKVYWNLLGKYLEQLI
jgi:aminoglycoside phosphotransferase family enzyme